MTLISLKARCPLAQCFGNVWGWGLQKEVVYSRQCESQCPSFKKSSMVDFFLIQHKFINIHKALAKPRTLLEAWGERHRLTRYGSSHLSMHGEDKS
jgi:hypothetical protein